MQTILLATCNAKKGHELQQLCAERFSVRTLKEVLNHDVNVVEDAADFAGNAAKKARVVAELVIKRGLSEIDIVIADDSGLVVDALDGNPGVRSARFSADAGYAPPGLSVDDANNRLLLLMMAPVPPPQRTARFISAVIARVINGGAEVSAQGSVEGLIAPDLLGDGGFGYDPLFVVQDGPTQLRGRRMAELSSSEKHGLSHRGRAMRALLAQLSHAATL